ncbi:hypothetical protein DID77_03025 [Candidatus Marinamargulisbacteria bacterium SCGC AG-439-L15]|nr:hypothetical protein DID77_03025 [Candidatus Marinamargulisbacteria bacterium SCGC AG-439-L15]
MDNNITISDQNPTNMSDLDSFTQKIVVVAAGPIIANLVTNVFNSAAQALFQYFDNSPTQTPGSQVQANEKEITPREQLEKDFAKIIDQPKTINQQQRSQIFTSRGYQIYETAHIHAKHDSSSINQQDYQMTYINGPKILDRFEGEHDIFHATDDFNRMVNDIHEISPELARIINKAIADLGINPNNIRRLEFDRLKTGQSATGGAHTHYDAYHIDEQIVFNFNEDGFSTIIGNTPFVETQTPVYDDTFFVFFNSENDSPQYQAQRFTGNTPHAAPIVRGNTPWRLTIALE